MNKHILALYETIMDELENQGFTDTQVDIDFLPRKSFSNLTIRITIHNWDNGRHAYYVIQKEELKIKESLGIDIMDTLNYLLEKVSNDERSDAGFRSV